MKVSIIIINWNGKSHLKDCLSSLSKLRYQNIQTIVVDNNSNDGSVNYIKTHFSYIEIIKNNANVGYAKGYEIGLKKAKGEYILLLNNDTIVEKNMLSELIKTMKSDRKICVVMPKLIMYPNTDKIDSVGSFFISNGMTYHFGREKNPELLKYNKQMDIYSAKGACMLVKKSLVNKIGLFDPDYFAYFEDTDFSHRVLLSGNRVVYCPKAVVYHKEGSTSKIINISIIQFHSYKNRICTYIKNLEMKNLLSVLPQLFLVYQATSFVHVLIGKFGIAWAVQKSIIWNIIHLPETLEKRKQIQNKIRKVSDDEFLPGVTRRVSLGYYKGLLTGLSNYKD
jgi:GT2 family glycosyltransferase